MGMKGAQAYKVLHTDPGMQCPRPVLPIITTAVMMMIGMVMIGQAGALQVFGAMGDTYIHETQPGHCTDACEPSTCPFPSGSGCRKPLSPNKPHLQGHLTG